MTTDPAVQASDTSPTGSAGADIPGHISIDGGAATLGLWRPSSSNLTTVIGRVRLRDEPVAGVQVRVGRYDVAAPTDADGRFRVAVDSTLAWRLPVSVAGAAEATIDGRAVHGEERGRLERMRSGVNVGYRLADLRTTTRSDGSVVVTGRALRADGAPAPPVTLVSYRLGGRITDGAGKPVAGATVVTPHPRPELLDVLRAVRRVGPVLLVLPRLRRARGRTRCR